MCECAKDIELCTEVCPDPVFDIERSANGKYNLVVVRVVADISLEVMGVVGEAKVELLDLNDASTVARDVKVDVVVTVLAIPRAQVARIAVSAVGIVKGLPTCIIIVSCGSREMDS